jgi:hypothetical protein
VSPAWYQKKDIHIFRRDFTGAEVIIQAEKPVNAVIIFAKSAYISEGYRQALIMSGLLQKPTRSINHFTANDRATVLEQ